jgi:hypothetical protein
MQAYYKVYGDLNEDGKVDDTDANKMQQNMGMTQNAVWSDGDMDGDGDVDFQDHLHLSVEYGYGT